MTKEEVKVKLCDLIDDDPLCARAYIRAMELIDKIDEPNDWHDIIKNPTDYAEFGKPAIVIERNKENGKVYTGIGVWEESKHWSIAIHTSDFPTGELSGNNFEVLAWKYIDSSGFMERQNAG